MSENFSDEASCPRHELASAGSALLSAALRNENLRFAFKRVRSNKGAAGVDGLDIDQTSRLLVTEYGQRRCASEAGGMRKGGPLSLLLANVLLDEVEKEFE